MTENHTVEYKSLRKFVGKSADLKDIAKTCVCFANAQGGTIIAGIEDGHVAPPAEQRITQNEVNLILRTLRGLALNTGIAEPVLETSPNGGQYFHFEVLMSVNSIATTSDGRVYMRQTEECQPVRSEDFMRLASERGGFQWELQGGQRIPTHALSKSEITFFLDRIRAAPDDRVSRFVKAKSNQEILEHYQLVQPDGTATNIGILWLGTPAQRARIRYPLSVQYIVYDEQERKVRKEVWEDFRLNPLLLLDDILSKAVELRYYHELPAGMFRKQVRHYPQEVIRELLANAFAHRLYTSANDITISVYPDRLEVDSPGGLPLGVTASTILHTRSRRNPHLMTTFYAIGLMEGEGSGYDLIYEKLSRDAKPLPVLDSSFNSLRVTVYSRILDTNTLLLLDYLSLRYTLTQKEIITAGIIAQHKSISATDLVRELQLQQHEERTRAWLGRLIEEEIILRRGVKKGTEYLINPKAYAAAKLDVKPSLKTLEPHRLRALIEEDLRVYPNSLTADIHRRLGELDLKEVQREVYAMADEGKIVRIGKGTKNRRYSLP